MRSLLVIVVASILCAEMANAVCRKCSTSLPHACMTNNTFRLCIDGQMGNETFTCPESKLCMDNPDICAQTFGGTNKPACDISVCGNCNGVPDGSFACTSRTTATMCLGKKPTTIRIKCAAGEKCLVAKANGGTWCTKDCDGPNQQVCNLDEPIDSPTTETPAPTPETTTPTPAPAPEVSTPAPTPETPVPTPETPTPETPTPAPTPETPAPTPATPAPVPTPETPTPDTPTPAPTPETPAPPTTQPTPTPTAPATASETCAFYGSTGRFPLLNDNSCNGFVSCRRRNDGWQGTYFSCSGAYFNSQTTVCETTKPASCQ